MKSFDDRCISIIALDNSRTSTLITDCASATRAKQGLRVLGNLPHGYEFLPTTAKDRDRLVAFLSNIDYS